jgi:hypothetical protein
VIPVSTAAQERKYVGRPVADVLRELQSDRLRIIFSSDLIPLSLSVTAEPKGRNPRDLAQQILASHGLTLQKGPGDTWIVIAGSSAAERQASARRPPPAPAQPKPPPTDPAQPPGPDPMRIDERVDVIDRLRETGGSPTAYALETRLKAQGSRLKAKVLCHTVKSHSVASSATSSGCRTSKDSGACGVYPILEYHDFRNSLLG